MKMADLQVRKRKRESKMKKVIGLLFCGVSVLSLGVSELKANNCGIPPGFKCSCALPLADILNGKINISCGPTYCPQGRVCTDTGDCCPEITDCSSINGETCKCEQCKDGTTKNSTEEKCCTNKENCAEYGTDCACTECDENFTFSSDKKQCCANKDNCAEYDANCACSECDTNFTFSSDASKCCANKDNCVEYDANCACTECKTGYKPTSDGSSCECKYGYKDAVECCDEPKTPAACPSGEVENDGECIVCAEENECSGQIVNDVCIPAEYVSCWKNCTSSCPLSDPNSEAGCSGCELIGLPINCEGVGKVQMEDGSTCECEAIRSTEIRARMWDPFGVTYTTYCRFDTCK